MTTHSHDHAVGTADAPRRSVAPQPHSMPSRRRWLLPGLAALTVAAGLVVAGVVSASTLLYVGLFGGMLFMHLGGHGGHEGHSAQPDGNESTGAKHLSERSDGSQPRVTISHHGLDHRASTAQNQSETTDHDQHSSHGCH